MKKYLFLLVFTSLIFSCSEQKSKVEIKTKNLSITYNESSAFIKRRLSINPSKDSVIICENFTITNLTEALKTFYNANSKSDKIKYSNTSSNNYDIYVINHNKNEDFNNLIIELSSVLKRKKLLVYKIEQP